MTEFESTPKPPNDVQRYYSDILYAENQSINLFLSLEQLVSTLPFPADLSASVLYDPKFMQHQLVAEPRAAKERMALMPFLHIGALLENSNIPTATVDEWYDDAVTGVSWVTSEEHDHTCLESYEGTLRHHSCEVSSVCPQRFLERYLSDDVYLPNFDSDIYRYRPERAAAIARDKLEIGVRHKILLADASETAWEAYCKVFDEYICEMLGLSFHDVDRDTTQ